MPPPARILSAADRFRIGFRIGVAAPGAPRTIFLEDSRERRWHRDCPTVARARDDPRAAHREAQPNDALPTSLRVVPPVPVRRCARRRARGTRAGRARPVAGAGAAAAGGRGRNRGRARSSRGGLGGRRAPPPSAARRKPRRAAAVRRWAAVARDRDTRQGPWPADRRHAGALQIERRRPGGRPRLVEDVRRPEHARAARELPGQPVHDHDHRQRLHDDVPGRVQFLRRRVVWPDLAERRRVRLVHPADEQRLVRHEHDRLARRPGGRRERRQRRRLPAPGVRVPEHRVVRVVGPGNGRRKPVARLDQRRVHDAGRRPRAGPQPRALPLALAAVRLVRLRVRRVRRRPRHHGQPVGRVLQRVPEGAARLAEQRRLAARADRGGHRVLLDRIRWRRTARCRKR